MGENYGYDEMIADLALYAKYLRIINAGEEVTPEQQAIFNAATDRLNAYDTELKAVGNSIWRYWHPEEYGLLDSTERQEYNVPGSNAGEYEAPSYNLSSSSQTIVEFEVGGKKEDWTAVVITKLQNLVDSIPVQFTAGLLTSILPTLGHHKEEYNTHSDAWKAGFDLIHFLGQPSPNSTDTFFIPPSGPTPSLIPAGRGIGIPVQLAPPMATSGVQTKKNIAWKNLWGDLNRLNASTEESSNAAPETEIASEVSSEAEKLGQVVKTDYGPAVQSTEGEALKLREYVDNRGALFKAGTFGRSNAADSQFWASENPLTTPGYAEKYGVDFKSIDYVIGGKIKSPYIIRPAPGLGKNIGGAFEVVTDPFGVELDFFYMP